MTDVFVFGSNLAGRHGKGAALEARLKWGAVYGQGEGRQGNAYAIPTKDRELSVLPLSVIASYVRKFLLYAAAHPEDTFLVTPVGTGLAGHSIDVIRPLFRTTPPNCISIGSW